MDAGLVVVQAIHILGGAAWLGASIFANAVVLPFIARQPVDRQRGLIAGVVLGPERVMIGAALLAALTGVARGTVVGPVRSTAVLGTPYGAIWLGAIAIAVAVFAIGGRVTSPAARRLRDDDRLWWADDNEAEAARTATMTRLRLGFRLELAGIMVIVVLMAMLPLASR